MLALSRKQIEYRLTKNDSVDIDNSPESKYGHKKTWKLPELKGIINRWQTFAHRVGGWNAVFMENHDQARTVSRFTQHRPEHRELAAKMLATCLCSLGGTLFLYQGQELGTANLPKHWGIEEYKDIESSNYYKECVSLVDTEN